MRADGNLVVTDINDSVIWSSNSKKYNGPYKLVLQEDRNLVIYGNKEPLWATCTNRTIRNE